MQSVYRRATIAYLVFLLLLVAPAIIIKRIGYSLSMSNETVWFFFNVAAVTVLTALCFIKRKDATKAAGFIAQLLPFLAVLYAFVVEFLFDGMDVSTVLMLAFYVALSSYSISLVYKSPRIFRIICTVCNSILLFGVMALLFLAMFSAGLGGQTVVKRLPSPDNSYMAILVDADSGALGGAMWVEINDHNAEINFGLGRLEKVKFLHSVKRREVEDIDLRWKDDRTLLIDGTPYHVQ